jgi:hypothetical protein
LAVLLLRRVVVVSSLMDLPPKKDGPGAPHAGPIGQEWASRLFPFLALPDGIRLLIGRPVAALLLGALAAATLAFAIRLRLTFRLVGTSWAIFSSHNASLMGERGLRRVSVARC